MGALCVLRFPPCLLPSVDNIPRFSFCLRTSTMLGFTELGLECVLDVCGLFYLACPL